MPDLPNIPVGFATKLGVIVSAVMGIAALVSAVINGDHTEETLGALAAAIIALYKVLDGRYNQATAQATVQAVTAPIVNNSLPTNDELADQFPGEAPDAPGTLAPGADFAAKE